MAGASAVPLAGNLSRTVSITFNATANASHEAAWGASPLPELSCDEEAVEVLRAILLACAVVFVSMLVVVCTLVAVIVLQVRKLGMLIHALRAATGSSTMEVCSGLLTTPQLRSSFQSKAKKNTKKTTKFTDQGDTTCSAPRDVDEEEL